jgi:hypothetical protein
MIKQYRIVKVIKIENQHRPELPVYKIPLLEEVPYEPSLFDVGFAEGDEVVIIKKETYNQLCAAAQHVLGNFFDKLE